MRDECERIADVIQQFFTETEYGYSQKKADIEIAKYRDKSAKAKAAVEARWAKKPNKPHTDVLQTQYERNTNHKPVTINHKPVTTKQSKDTNGFNFKSSVLSLDVNLDTLNDWLEVRKKKKSTNTKTAFNNLLREIDKSGLHPQQAIEMAAANSWAGFNSDWIKTKSTKSYSKVTERTIQNAGAFING